MKSANVYYENMITDLQKVEDEKTEKEVQLQAELEYEKKMEITDADELKAKSDNFLNVRSQSSDIDQSVMVYLMKLWETCAGNYIQEVETALKSVRDQRELYSIQIAETQRAFIQLLERSGEKRILAREFQKEYNQFVGDHPDLIEEQNCKEELHQRVEDLCDKLFELIEDKREEYQQERKKIMESR